MKMEFEKYHKIHILGDEDNEGILSDPEDEIIIEEKMDGGNFRFAFVKGKLILGSRTRELDGDNPNCKNFKRCMEFVQEKIEKKRKLKIAPNMIFYGECMIKHTFDYDWDKIPPYLGFDIKLFGEKSEYLDYDAKAKIFKELDLPMVPLIKRQKMKDIISTFTEKSIPESAYAHPTDKNFRIAEGIVIKNYSKQRFAKIVREEFKEQMKDTFGRPKKWARQEGDNALVVATYCTNPRIDKMIFKLIDDGHKLEMKMMEKLPKRVIEDIYEEHSKEICFSNWSVDFREIRKKITRRCLAVLKQVIQNNALNKK